MKVKELKKILDNYADDAEVIVVDWSDGVEYESVGVGSDEDDEYTEVCRISY